MITSPYNAYRPPTTPCHLDEEEWTEVGHQTFYALGETILTKLNHLELKISKPEEIMDSRQVCEYLKIRPKQLYRLRSKYRLPCHNPTGKALRFKRTEVDAWLETCGLTF